MRSVFAARYRITALALLSILATGAVAFASPLQFVREQRDIEVLGHREIWQLVWAGKPVSTCGPNEVWMATTCPCAGAAYAESGRLLLVRRRAGRIFEQMNLTPLFNVDFDTAAEGEASLQRWPLEESDLARETAGDPTLIPEIERRPAPLIMRFADYANTGAATVFLIQVGTKPCGKLQFAAVGLTPENPHLHALSSAANPGAPLIMALPAWQALLTGPGPHTVPTWDCGDHGSDRYTDLVVLASHGRISVKERQFSCSGSGLHGKLLSVTDQ